MSNYRARKYKAKHKLKSRRMKKLRSRSSILKNRGFWDVVLGVVFISSLAWLLFFSPAFEIRELGITAPGGLGHLISNVEQEATRELNKPFLKFLNRKSFFSVRVSAIREKILASHPEIEAMLIKRVFPHNLFLELYERKEVGVWCYDEMNCFFVDKKGVIFKNGSATSTEGLVLIFSQTKHQNELLEQVISQAKMAQILEVHKTFEQDLQIGLNRFLTDGQEMLHAVTKDGWSAYFVLGGDMEMALTRLKLLFEKEISQEQRKNLQYIDLRFSKAYYK